jgi:Ca2+-binding RTX toxin-like protein
MPIAAGVTVFGSDGNDKVSAGSAANNVFHGQSGNDTFTLESSTGPNTLNGNQNRDKARLGSVSGTSCHLIETIVDLAHHARSCS